MSGHITREEREAARAGIDAGRICWRCGGPTGDNPGARRLCAPCGWRADRLARELAAAPPRAVLIISSEGVHPGALAGNELRREGMEREDFERAYGPRAADAAFGKEPAE